MKSLTFRRAEFISIDGGPGVSTFLDETGDIVFVDVRSLIEQIGLPIVTESDRLTDNPQLITQLQLCSDYSYNEGFKQKSLFMPLDNINDYLYSIPIESLEGAVAGNLQHYRVRFAIEADRHWSRLENSPAVQNGLDWRRLLVISGRQQITQAVRALDGDATEIIQAGVRQVAFGALVPIDNLDSRQLDLLNLAYSLALDVIVFCVENGYDFEYACDAIQQGLDEHIRPWNF